MYKYVRTKRVKAPYVPHRVAGDNVLMWSVTFCQDRSTDANNGVHSGVIDKTGSIISSKEMNGSPALPKPQMLKFK